VKHTCAVSVLNALVSSRSCSKLCLVQESDHSSAQSTAPSSANVNNNNLQTPRSNNNQNNNTSVVQPDGLTVIKGRRMEPGEKARVPNKLLVHFVKKLNGKEVDKVAVLRNNVVMCMFRSFLFGTNLIFAI